MIDQHNRPALTDGVVAVRAPISSDIEDRFALGRSSEILRMFVEAADPNEPYTREMAEKWVAQNNDGPNRWCITYQGSLAGWIWLHSANDKDRNCTLAIGLLDEDMLGKGIGTRAMRLVLSYAFDTLNMHRVALRAIDYNVRAVAAYKKLGFVEEGRLRENAWFADQWHDDIMMGLLASEYQR
ncbi:GNAT family protein [Octadecabacter sp. 1_MG-2023]|uniref:GNAT family N-acetyltransferase n=1 Tax=unclassified Octadecabacter TaxID=196158 RepID=UPI001C09C55F|nr:MULTISPECIES: GNAT family protein [unclassified Octadecabacter]MBU2993358.1 GNAT family N-acetyltransferase [Octadecabacter sp. B2R22]MDO6733186.1 GNAT family protein [Octadecabacter sp. 1_MG-2023]